MTNLESLSLTEAAAAIRHGEFSPLDYVRALLDRIDRLESVIEAWVTIDRDAVLAEARAAEAEARQNAFRGPLHGIPVGVKDIFYTKGLRTTIGSQVFKDFVPKVEARALAQLKRAGAIVLGKCVTTEFAYLDPGKTRNAWNPRHTPGGSSSGSAASVAAMMCPAAIGSQTVGSIGRPAAYNGVVALVPTQQRVSRTAVFPLSWTLDHVGGFTRSVADMKLLLNALLETPERPEPRAREPRLTGPVRVGLLRGNFYVNASDEMRVHTDALGDRLANAGFNVEEAQPPAIFDIGPAVLRTILRSEMAAVHQELYSVYSESYGAKIRALVETGFLVDSVAYLRALRIRKRYQREMVRLFDQFDVLVSPGASGTAPDLTSTGDSVMQLPWALADFPTLSLPLALGANGLPIGVQLTAAPLAEDLLLEIGKLVEAVISFRAKPDYPDL